MDDQVSQFTVDIIALSLMVTYWFFLRGFVPDMLQQARNAARLFGEE
jgi:hypothetical protein